ncbi:MAG: peptidyl-prolyl cis-trans isomerase [Nitrospiria bacterium]
MISLKNTIFLSVFLAILMVETPLMAKEILIDRIAAVVNTEPILLSEVQERLENEREKDSTTLLTLLNKIIDQKLQVQAAHKKGITVSDIEIRQALEETRSKNGLTSDEAFKKSLEKEKLTLEKVTEEIKLQILIRKLFQRDVLQDVVVQERDLLSYYQNHSDLYKIPEKREISQILFDMKPDDDSSDKEKVKEAAQILFNRLKNGEKIEQIMMEKSDFSRIMSYSELGAFQKGELLPVLDQAAFSTEPGKWSSPVETSLGIHLLRVNQKPAKYKPYEEVSKEIREKVFQEKSELSMQLWIANLRKSATIEIPLLKDPAFKNQGGFQ